MAYNMKGSPMLRNFGVEASPAKQTKFPDAPKTIERREKRQGEYRKVLADPETDLKTWKGTRKKFVKSGGKGFGS